MNIANRGKTIEAGYQSTAQHNNNGSQLAQGKSGLVDSIDPRIDPKHSRRDAIVMRCQQGACMIAVVSLAFLFVCMLTGVVTLGLSGGLGLLGLFAVSVTLCVLLEGMVEGVIQAVSRIGNFIHGAKNSAKSPVAGPDNVSDAESGKRAVAGPDNVSDAESGKRAVAGPDNVSDAESGKRAVADALDGISSRPTGAFQGTSQATLLLSSSQPDTEGRSAKSERR